MQAQIQDLLRKAVPVGPVGWVLEVKTSGGRKEFTALRRADPAAFDMIMIPFESAKTSGQKQKPIM